MQQLARKATVDLVGTVRALVERAGAQDEWHVTVTPTWCHVSRHDAQIAQQGWKLHVSATIASAADVLERAASLLIEQRCTFKFAAALSVLGELNGPNYPREGAGKFMTVYPDDEVVLELARLLHEATQGLPGPSILSDRPYRPASLVHYRYGVFSGVPRLHEDGSLRSVLLDPDGRLVEDRREPRFTPPSWVRDPFSADANEAPDAACAAKPTAVLLDGRYEAREALRHANKGGVYRAFDRKSGRMVVVKEARPHTFTTLDGRDARDVLEREHAMLRRVESLGVAPAALGLFEQGGHRFCAQELAPGEPLRNFVSAHAEASQLKLAVARNLAAAVGRLHGAGIVLRDLNPNNIIAADDGRVTLIDLELAIDEGAPLDGDRHAGRGTPGYIAPEQVQRATPHRSADSFSLGATLAFLFSGHDPLFVEDVGACARSHRVRLAAWLEEGPRRACMPRWLRELVLELCDEDPRRRPSVAQVEARLAPRRRLPRAGDADVDATGAPLSDDQLDAAIDGIVACTIEKFEPRGERAWPSTSFGESTDPLNVQHGAAGVLGALVAALAARPDDERLRDTIRRGCRYIERGLDSPLERHLPGLYFGTSGIAWALADAARALDEPGLRERALEFALGLDTASSACDITHGRAGLGLTLLHLWHLTGESACLERAARCAESLLAEMGAGPVWIVPDGVDSPFAGQRFHGLAHGTAGVGLFLLAFGARSGERDAAAAAYTAADSLIEAATRLPGGGLAWPMHPDRDGRLWFHWCNGSSGVGTFLAHVAHARGDERSRQAAIDAGRAAWSVRFTSTIAYCHGLPGDGDYLLELADILDVPQARSWANDVARELWRRRVLQHGRVVFADHDRPAIADYHEGHGGLLSFLLRLRGSQPRLWHLEAAT